MFYVPLGFEAWRPDVNDEDQNTSREIIRRGGYSPEPETTCGGSTLNHDNVFTSPHHRTSSRLHPHWDAASHRRRVQSTSRTDPEGISGRKITKWVDGLVAPAPMTGGTASTVVAMRT